MNELPNLDRVDDLERGAEPEAEADKPADVGTRARCLLPLVNVADLITDRTPVVILIV
jgi:hypothetical protein